MSETMVLSAPPAPMRCLVSQGALLQGLRQVAPAVGPDRGLPSLACVTLTAENGALTLWAANLEMGVKVALAADIGQVGAVALPFRRFSRLMQAAPDAALELTATADGYGARLQWAEAEYLVYGIPPDRAVQMPQPADDAPAMQITPAALRWLLDQTAYAAALDNFRPYLCGVQVRFGDGRLRAVATDSVRIGVAWADVERVAEGFPELIISRPCCQYLGRLLGRAGDTVELRVSNSILFARVGDTLVTSRLMEGQYPDVLKLVPTQYSMTATLDRQSWLGVLRRQGALSRGDVGMEFTPQGVFLCTSIPEVGAARERVQGTYTGEPLEIGFNSRYLIECLSRMNTQLVTAEMSGARNPVRIRPVGSTDVMCVVLPLITY